MRPYQKKNPRGKRKFRRAARGDGEKGEEKKKGKEFWFSYRRSESYLRVFFSKFSFRTRRAERSRIFGVFFGASEASTLEQVQKEIAQVS